MASETSISKEKQLATVTSNPTMAKPVVNVIGPSSCKRGLFQWFHPDDGPDERRLVTKLDFSILIFSCFGFWTLYIDRGMFGNAYVSGMREDLQMLGNQFVQANALFTSGYALSIIPLTMLNTRVPSQYAIPFAMMIWALFTVLITTATTYRQVWGYRFLVGFGEGAFFPSIHYVFGCWYRPDEIARRSGIFYLAASAGTASTGFVAAGIYKGFDGALGKAGWRWMFLIGGVVTFPVAIFGLIFFPGSTDSKKAWFLTEAEYELAKERMRLVGRKPKQAVSWNLASIKRFVGGWHFWVLIPATIIIQQGYLAQSNSTWTLWIRSNPQYDVATVNNLTTIGPGVQIIWIISFSLLADRFGHRARLPIFGFAMTLQFLSHLAFVIYDKSSFGYKWFAVAVGYTQNATMPVWFSWANLICKDDAEERAFVLGSMLAISMAFQAWVPLLALKTVDSPRFFIGYTTQLVTIPIAFGMIVLLYYLDKESRHKPQEQPNAEGADQAKPVALTS